MHFHSLFPELIVKDVYRSTPFYVDVLGLRIEYGRPEEQFHFLSFSSAQLMLLEDIENFSNFAISHIAVPSSVSEWFTEAGEIDDTFGSDHVPNWTIYE